MLESWAHWTGVAAVSFTALAAVAGILSWGLSENLSKKKDAAALRFQEETKRATSAADARGAEANARASEANARAASLETRSAELEKGSEVLRKENLGLQIEVLRLREKLANRHLASEASKNIQTEAMRFRGQAATLLANPEDPEIIALANEIVSVLNGAGWTLSVLAGHDSSRAVRGILIEVSPDADQGTRLAAVGLAAAIAAEGLDVATGEASMATPGITYGTSDPEAKMKITVGKKP